MPVINRIADFFKDMQDWRQHIHSNPELGFECNKTADFVISKLKGVHMYVGVWVD